MDTEAVWAVGLMSGTSMDGIDAALVKTDGETVAAFGDSYFLPYDPDIRTAVRAVLGERTSDNRISTLEKRLTELNAEAVRALLAKCPVEQAAPRVIGFHGQTITHDPAERFTWQLGDGRRLAELLKTDVVYDFRSADVAAGGEGAPFAPAYHRAVMQDKEKPLVVLNLGGVGNVTWLGPAQDPVSFDTGPANALLDDWVSRHTGQPCDVDGEIARRGTVDRAVLAVLMDHPYFDRPPPKSLDRNDFSLDPVEALSVEDGAATLAAFTVETVSRAPYPEAPRCVWVTGGGRKNPTLMRGLAERLGIPVLPVEEAGLDGDNLEAQAFGFLAVRHLRGRPLSFPSTTNVPQPLRGGRLAKPL